VRRPWLRLLILGAVIGLAFSAIAFGLPGSPGELRAAVHDIGPLAPVALILAWIVLTPVLFSGTLLAAVGGLAFGTWIGSGIGAVGAVVGGLVAFAIARRFGHRAAQQLSGPRLTRIQERLAGRGFLTVLAARLAPGVPSTWLHYACGLSRIRARDFAAGLAVGGTPKVFAYATLGGSAGNLDSAPAIVAMAIIGAMAVLGLGLALRARLASRGATA
jgi:uncharacterized membrane protein YdjX (TVP38/TMEM64 family)